MKFTEVKNSTSTDKKCGSSETICQSPVISEGNGTTCLEGVSLTKPRIALDEIPDEMYDGTNLNEQEMVEYYHSRQLTKCCNVEDVAELIGEISLSLNGLTSSVLFDCPVIFEQCLHKCLSPSEKLSWLKKLTILDSRAREVHWTEDQECAEEETPICPLISITKCLLGHVGNHLATSKLDPCNHFQVIPVADDAIELSKQRIKFVTHHFSLTLLKHENSTKCHNCDVAVVLLYILSRYIQENTSVEQVPGHDLRESKVQSIPRENEKGITLENLDSSSKCCSSIATFRPNGGIKSNIFSAIKTLSSEHFVNSVEFQDQESIYLNSAFEEEGLIHSALLPLKEDENSSESRSGTCETMPPSTLYFGTEEEMNVVKVTYGTMDKVLEFLKRDVIIWKNSNNRDQTAGVILNKYKQIIKIKNGNYNEGVHYIKGTSSPLGSGCSGKCYLARDIYTRQVFCLKIVQSFKNSEIEVWAALSDVKGTPKFYGILFHTDYVFILQEFIHGWHHKANAGAV